MHYHFPRHLCILRSVLEPSHCHLAVFVAYATVQNAGAPKYGGNLVNIQSTYMLSIYIISCHLVWRLMADFKLNTRILTKGQVGVQIHEPLQLFSVSGKAFLVDKVYNRYTGLVPCQLSSIR